MCLTLKTRTKVTKEDIVCYKRLTITKDIDVTKFKDGQSFTGTIMESPVNGHISIEDNRLFLCTDSFNGLDCKDKKGHKYSWVFDDDVSDINGEKIEMKTCYRTAFMNFPVEIGETYHSLLKKSEIDLVDEGLHSYVRLMDAPLYGGECIVRCLIPKGSRYYEGTFCGLRSYASDTLTYVEIVA